MSPIWWYLAGVATVPILFTAWVVIASLGAWLRGDGILTVTTTVNGHVTERVWPR